MPGNTIKINNKPELEWYVGDSTMKNLTDWLNRNGIINGSEKSKIEILKIWLKDLIYPYKENQYVYDIEKSNAPGIEQKWRFKLYTNTYLYRITAIDRKKDEGYLNCICFRRMASPGETSTRGSGLSHGPFTEATWNSIKNVILRNEFLELEPPIEQVPDWSEGPEMVDEITGKTSPASASNLAGLILEESRKNGEPIEIPSLDIKIEPEKDCDSKV